MRLVGVERYGSPDSTSGSVAERAVLGIELMPYKEACRDSATRVQQVLDSALDAVVSIDLDGRIVVWNGRAEELFGWSFEEVSGQLLEETIIPEDLIQEHREGISRFLETGSGTMIGKPTQLEALHRSGRRIPIELSITPIRIEQDAAGFTGFIRDLRPARERQRMLEVSDERLQRVLDGSDQGFWDIYLDGQRSALSSRCSTMLGFPSGTIANVPPAESAELHPEDRERVQTAWEDHLTGLFGEVRHHLSPARG